MVKILVFDTETTGVPPPTPGTNWQEKERFDTQLLDTQSINEEWNQMIDIWPSIIQLSYIVYDSESPDNSIIINKYIDIPDNIVISEGSIAVHHITREKIASEPPENRATITESIREFMEYVKSSDIVVGHNVQFDRKMVIAELIRLSKEANLPQIEDMMDDSKFECTMIETTPICKLKRKIEYIDKKTGKQNVYYKIKSPKLSEAYQFFFGYEPSGEALHDAIIDVVVCLRVFYKYKYNEDICGKNSKITDYILSISPEGYTCPEPEEKRRQTFKGGKRKRKSKSKKYNQRKTKRNKTKRNKK